jgi:DNA repair protein RadD
MNLYPFQSEVIDRVNAAIAAGDRRILLVAPTGSGKTVIGSAIINTMAANWRTVLVLAHRREIVRQTSEKT